MHSTKTQTMITRILLALSLAFSASAVDWKISTFAGTGEQGGTGDGGAATRAKIDNPFGVTRGPDGAIYFCEYTGQRIRKVTPDGIIHTVAGSGQKGYSGDGGPALKATFNLPHELRFDAAGDLYIVDMTNHAVRKVEMKTGIISTIAGNGQPGYSGDGGPAIKAQFKQPHSIQFGPEGALFVCDIGNHVIRRIDMKTGIITTFAGTGKPGATPDGAPIVGTPLKGPRSLDFDPAGNLWLCTREGNQVFKFDLLAGKIHHIAGNGKKGLTGNGGPAKEATLSGPKGIAMDAEGNAWLADCESHTLRMVEAKTGRIHLIVGTGQKGNGGDGAPLKCELARPHGVFVDADGSIYIGDSEAHKVRVLRKSAR
jgi:streptogramin lyase